MAKKKAAESLLISCIGTWSDFIRSGLCLEKSIIWVKDPCRRKYATDSNWESRHLKTPLRKFPYLNVH
jgi:hypothetical protein